MVSVVTLPPAVLSILSSHPPLCQTIAALSVCVCEITYGGGSISASRVNLKSALCVFMHMCVCEERLVVYNCLQTVSISVCVLEHKRSSCGSWLLPDCVFCLFVCVYGFFITSSRKLSQPSLRAHPGWRSFPASHHAHPHSAQFTLLLPLDLDGLMLGWGNASNGSAFLTSDPDVSFICRSALRGCGVRVCLMSGNSRFWSFCQFFGGFFTVLEQRCVVCQERTDSSCGTDYWNSPPLPSGKYF